ncbi:MAG: N-acetylmuramic acid 6-phosphate etherase [Planctomycetes bacterium]|nr:N-acetylmuramic acid 6-phosphate etherase [Planctomycetota bacterium]
MTLPPDRAHVLTEQRNTRSAHLHQASIAECIALIQDEDRSIALALDRARPALTAFLAAVEPGFLRGGRLIYLGAGTSGRLGVLDASEAPPTFQVPPDRIIGLIAGGDGALRRSSEGKEDDPAGAVPELTALGLRADDAVLGIAAGGSTPYVLGALRWAAARDPRPVCGLLACSPVEQLPQGILPLVVATGPEVITGSTRMKAGTATKLALNTISTTLMVRAGKVYENLMVDVRATNDKLRDRAARIVSTLTGLARAESFVALDAAGGSAKVAVAMVRRGLEREHAERLLAAAGGRLDHVLDRVEG